MAAWVKEFDLDGIDVDYEVRIFYVLMINSTDFSERTSTPSTQGTARLRRGSLPLRDNFAPSFLKETLFSPMLVCFLHVSHICLLGLSRSSAMTYSRCSVVFS